MSSGIFVLPRYQTYQKVNDIDGQWHGTVYLRKSVTGSEEKTGRVRVGPSLPAVRTATEAFVMFCGPVARIRGREEKQGENSCA
jgi:hypothetical protein